MSHKMLFGSDFPLIRPDAWMAAAGKAGFKDEVLQAITKDNAVKLLKLGDQSRA
ncbi:MAG: amidohydrolase family protein [Woeseiaceae bacterium]|nr:amidohydrolase family protein [Woeseiaceae bacterium]